MITAQEGDYKALLKDLYMIAVYDYTPEFWAEVEKELKTDITWKEVCSVVEKLQQLGKTNLREGLWLHLGALKRETIARRKVPEDLKPQDYQ
jgi:hypothetical protein